MNLRSALSCASALALVIAAAGCAAAPINKPLEAGPTGIGAANLTAARKFLEGRWALESFEVFAPGQQPITLKGMGSLLYDDFGNLTIDIRADEASADRLRAAGIDIRDGRISSEGRTAIDMPNQTLTYFIEGQPASGTGPLATSRPRHWVVEGNMLTLTTRDDTGKPMSVAKWRKAS